jgi:hypothetical protein
LGKYRFNSKTIKMISSLNSNRNSDKNLSTKVIRLEKGLSKKIVDRQSNIHEISFQTDENGLARIIRKEKISKPQEAHIELLCREYVNQDVFIKIRNGKKVEIHRSAITRSGSDNF